MKRIVWLALLVAALGIQGCAVYPAYSPGYYGGYPAYGYGAPGVYVGPPAFGFGYHRGWGHHHWGGHGWGGHGGWGGGWRR